jgi:hypothetical protein
LIGSGCSTKACAVSKTLTCGCCWQPCRYACIDDTLAVIPRREKSVSRNLDSMRVAALRSMGKNRALLPARLRGRFWRSCLAGVYTDYAKPAYRAGRLGLAYADTLRALMLSPLGRGRLCLGLLRDFLLRKPV